MAIEFKVLKSLLVFGITLCLVLVGPVALGQAREVQNPLQAQVEIAGANITGTLILTQRENGLVQIRGRIQGDRSTLTPGLHGLHIHAAGVCEPDAQPPFSTAGGHFDPGPFGSELPVQANHPYHLGDLPNLVVDEQGNATYNVQTSRVTLSEGPLTLFDENGSAIIIHQLTDQQKAGGTAAESGGGRIACGVVTRDDRHDRQERSNEQV